MKSITKWIIIVFVLLIYFSIYSGCSTNETISTNPSEPCVRIGAICNDGTRSTATGSGACSSHGGVKQWICE